MLEPKKPFSTKAYALVHRLNLIGCSHPTQQTVKWMLAVLLLAHYGEQMPEPQIRQDKLHELKGVIIAERRSYPIPETFAFPGNPNHLPKAAFDHAYSDGAPAPKEFPGITVVAANGIPLRKNNSLLKPKGGIQTALSQGAAEQDAIIRCCC